MGSALSSTARMDIAELVQSRSARPVVRRRRGPPLAALALTALGGLALAGMLQPEESPAPAPAPSARVSSEAEAPETAQAVPNALAWMLDPAPVLDTASRGFVRQAPQVSAFRAPPAPERVLGSAGAHCRNSGLAKLPIWSATCWRSCALSSSLGVTPPLVVTKA